MATAIKRAFLRTRTYFVVALLGALSTWLVKSTANVDALGMGALCLLIPVYFVGYPLVCVLVTVVIEYRSLSRNTASD